MTSKPPYPSRRSFLAFSAFAAASAATLAACGAGGTKSGKDKILFEELAATQGDPETTSLKYQGQASAVSLPELAESLGFLGPVKLDWVGNTISGPQDIQSAATKQTHFGGAFNGAVVKLIAAGAPITAVVSFLGLTPEVYNGFYVLEDSDIHTADDLVGKKVAMNTLGAQYEAVLDIHLQRAGFSNDRLKKVERIVVPPLNTEESLRRKQIDVGALGGILREKALATGGVRELFSDYSTLGPVDLDVYAFRDDFIQDNPNTVRVFTTGVAQAIEWARVTPRDEVIERFTKIIKDRGRSEDTSTLKYWKGTGVAKPGGVISDDEWSTWITWLEGQGQIDKGKVTPADIYTNAFNPYTQPNPPAIPAVRPI